MIKQNVKPILFNTEMVQAILDGRKTVTRRTIKPQPKMQLCYTCMGSHNVGRWAYPSADTYKYWGDEWKLPEDLTEEERSFHWTPPCHTDDILYVRETWAYHGNPKAGRPMHYSYRADMVDPQYFEDGFMATWRPSIHMPKEAARIFLKVKHVEVVKLQDMGGNDSLSEGVKLSLDGLLEKREPATAPFSRLWDSTVKKDDLSIYGWDANPFVWKIEFERVKKEEVRHDFK